MRRFRGLWSPHWGCRSRPTSANLAGLPECTYAACVRDQIGDRIPLIVDGGPTGRKRADDDCGSVRARWGRGRFCARGGDSNARHRACAAGAMIVPDDNLRPARRGALKRAAPTRSRLLLWSAGVLTAAALGWVLWVNEQIQFYSHRDEARPADAIAVFGAAEYDGRPSPVLRARLDHALELYRRGLAPLMITLGGGRRGGPALGGRGRSRLSAGAWRSGRRDHCGDAER
jgi:hypothetical protein